MTEIIQQSLENSTQPRTAQPVGSVESDVTKQQKLETANFIQQQLIDPHKERRDFMPPGGVPSVPGEKMIELGQPEENLFVRDPALKKAVEEYASEQHLPADFVNQVETSLRNHSAAEIKELREPTENEKIAWEWAVNTIAAARGIPPHQVVVDAAFQSRLQGLTEVAVEIVAQTHPDQALSSDAFQREVQKVIMSLYEKDINMMKTANGSDLWEGDAQKAQDVGIIHVDPADTLRDIKVATLTQHKLNRKQIVIVLPPGKSNAFQKQKDFLDLKDLHKQLPGKIIFIIPKEQEILARRNALKHYNSLEDYKMAEDKKHPVKAKTSTPPSTPPASFEQQPPAPAPISSEEAWERRKKLLEDIYGPAFKNKHLTPEEALTLFSGVLMFNDKKPGTLSIKDINAAEGVYKDLTEQEHSLLDEDRTTYLLSMAFSDILYTCYIAAGESSFTPVKDMRVNLQEYKEKIESALQRELRKYPDNITSEKHVYRALLLLKNDILPRLETAQSAENYDDSWKLDFLEYAADIRNGFFYSAGEVLLRHAGQLGQSASPSPDREPPTGDGKEDVDAYLPKFFEQYQLSDDQRRLTEGPIADARYRGVSEEEILDALQSNKSFNDILGELSRLAGELHNGTATQQEQQPPEEDGLASFKETIEELLKAKGYSEEAIKQLVISAEFVFRQHVPESKIVKMINSSSSPHTLDVEFQAVSSEMKKIMDHAGQRIKEALENDPKFVEEFYGAIEEGHQKGYTIEQILDDLKESEKELEEEKPEDIVLDKRFIPDNQVPITYPESNQEKLLKDFEAKYSGLSDTIKKRIIRFIENAYTYNVPQQEINEVYDNTDLSNKDNRKEFEEKIFDLINKYMPKDDFEDS